MQSPIIKRILIFGILSSVISLMLAFCGFGVVEFYKIKNESVNKLNSQMDILAYNLQPTLLFDDKEAADKILHSLKDDKSINSAIVYRADGHEFTFFAHTHGPDSITLSKGILYNHKVIGHLVMGAIYVGIKDRFISYFLVSLLILLISIPASYFISEPIRKQVSLGVVQLEQQSDRLRLLADQVAVTEQKERKRIAALIHDHLQQILAASKLQLAMITRELGKQNYEKVTVGLNRVEEFLNEATRAARTLTVELRPPVLYEDGLAAAFQWMANKFKNDHDLEISFKQEELPIQLSDNLKIMIFESVKELLFNVVKYSGVHKADLFLKYDGGRVIVTVTDQGNGFDQNLLEKKSAEKGFGLFSIRERLKLLDGELKISSQPGKGTQVEIMVPVGSAMNPTMNPMIVQANTGKGDAKRDKKIRILLVDDHKIVREGIANLLKENTSFNVVAQAEDGLEAVEKAETFMPDVIIMDVNMPKLNGIEATRVIKNKFSNIKIIGLSVQDEKDIAESMKKAGALTLMNKAGDPQDLIQTILGCRE